jgi:uncharacterized protein with von Willebrand factor type A (vWA) domain
MQRIDRVIDSEFEQKVHPDCPVHPQISAINKYFEAAQAMHNLAVKQKELQNLTNDPNLKQLQEQQEEADKEELDEDVANAQGAGGMGGMGGDGEAEVDEDQDNTDFVEDYMPTTGKGWGRNSRYDNQHTGNHICRITESFVQQVSQQQLALYELGRKFSLALEAKCGKKFKPVKEVAADREQRNVTSLTDLPKVVASSHALPKEVFDQKLVKGELVKEDYRKPDDKKKLLYILTDSSGSMRGHLGGSRFSLYTRGAFAGVMSAALVRKVKEDGGLVFFRFFAGGTSAMYKATQADEFDLLLKQVMMNDYSGGSTDIQGAILTAYRDIAKADAAMPLAQSEIICITDCEDGLDLGTMKAALNGREFHVLDVSGSTEPNNPVLKELAVKYYKVNESAPDVTKIVEEVV